MGINFEEKCWIGKVQIFLFFWHWATTFRCDSNIFIPRKKRFHSTSAEDFFGEHILKKGVIYIVREFVEKIVKRPANGECFPAELSKLLFLIPEEQCGFMLFPKKLSAHSFFFGFEWKTLHFHQTIFSRFVKTAFFRVQRNIFDEKIFFIEFIKLDSCSG